MSAAAGAPVALRGIEAELAALWRPPEGESARPAVRACMSNLIALCASREERERVLADLPEIAREHPCRALLLAAEPDGPETIEASVTAVCYLTGRGQKVCAEQVLLRCAEGAAERLPAAVRPLLIGDLPTSLWWTPSDRSPPQSGKLFGKLAPMAGHVIYDSRGWLDPFRSLVAGAEWASRAPRRQVLSDLAWRWIEPWRRVIAQSLDPAVAPGALERIRAVEIEHGPHALPAAWMLVGWLADRLGWKVAGGEVSSGSRVHWSFRAASGTVEVDVRRLSEGDPELAAVAVSWQREDAGRGPLAVERFQRLGPERIGVMGQAPADAPRVVAAPRRARAALVAQELAARSAHALFRESLGVCVSMAAALKE